MSINYNQPQQDSISNEDLANMLSQIAGDPDDENNQQLFQTNDMVGLIKEYLKLDIPKEMLAHPLVQQFWAVLSKDIKLTFLDRDDVEDLELLFDQSMLNYLMSTPSYEFSNEDEQMLDQLRIYFIAALKRSQGTKSHRFNERIIEGGTINQTIKSNTDIVHTPGGQRGGMGTMLSKLF